MATFLNPDGTPADMSPEEIAEAQTAVAAPEQPAERLIDPTNPPKYNDEAGNPLALTPQEKAEARKAAGLVDPLLDFSPDEMADFARQDPTKRFNILGDFVARQEEVKQDPDAVARVAEGWRKYKESTGWGSFPTVGEMATTAGHVGMGLANYIGTLFKNYPKRLLTESGSPANLEATRNLAEVAAASETSLTGLAHLGERLFKGNLPATGTPVTAEDGTVRAPLRETDVDKLFSDVERAQQIKDVVEKGGVLGSEKAVQGLKEAGYPIRPEEVEKMAAGDPFGFFLFGKAFGALGKVMPGVPEAALSGLGRGAANVAGKGIELAAAGAAKAAPVVAKYAPVAMAAKGAFLGAEGAVGPVAGAIVGHQVGKGLAKTVTKAIPKLQSLVEAGKQIAGKEAVKSNFAQLAKDVAQATPAAAYELGKGLGFDVGFAATAETPEEMQGVGLGLVFGLAGVGGRMGSPVLSGQLIAPREWGTSRVVPSNKYFPGMDQLHQEAFTQAPAGVRARVNAVRAFLKEALPNADFIYAGPKPETGVDPLVAQLTSLGVSPEQANLWANQSGLFSKNVNGKQLVIARDVEAAPHESFHALQDVLGESKMRELDTLIQSDPKYQGKTWEAMGESYANRLGWDPASGQTWQDYLLDASKWGVTEAAEKLARGDQMGPATAQSIAEALQAAKDTWRTVLTPEEQTALANKYLSREIAADNFDAVFKHGLGADKGIAGWVANAIGHFVRAAGGDPLAGRAAEGSGFPLSADVAKVVKGQAVAKLGGKPAPAVPAPRVPIPRGMPTTPEQQQEAASEAQGLASRAPEAPPTAKGTKSARELLGIVAEAIAQRTGVKINYLSAPGEPAAATTGNRPARRAIIETFRSMPAAARALWEKTFFPERVLQLKDGSYQVLGWSPEVFAANAHKTAGAIADMVAKDPRLAGVLSPYEIDPATRSFTPEGWKQLFNDTQTFVQNQIAGRTGSGVPLVVPKETAARGLFAPSLQAGAGGLEQFKADFISSLYNFKLPETARITGGKLPLNLAGQAISEATIPGRVVEPVRPRGIFEGPKAEEQGIAGKPIQEVNPLRNALEQAAKNTGVPVPSLIESVQRLNLSNIAEVAHAPEAPEFRGNTLTLTAGFQPPKEAQFRVNKPAEEIADFRPEEVRGAEVNLPRTTYHEAAQGEGNPWVRRSADPERSTAVENADRTLLVQISSDLINPESLAGAAKDEATRYYDMLYSGARPGYARLQDFWEIPQWIGFASKFLPDADVYVVRDVAQAREFLKQAGYGRIAFSALDTNKALIREIIDGYEGKVDIGGYVDPKTFSDLPQVKWHDSMESMAKGAGVPYEEGVDYRHFQGSDVIPRLTMSKGCRHKCAFCSVPKIVEETPANVVRQQADAIAELGSKLVYLNDKTFGQAGNYKLLSELNQQILAKNPDFKGFIIQTTAAQLKVMPAEWLKQSGIKFVELGIESYNDPILKAMHKPATESLITQVTGKLRDAGIALIPNIIIGFPEETAETYSKTLNWLKSNKDIISHANIYNLALYKDAELGKKVITASEGDFNENVLEKSFHTNPEIHRQFAGDVYGLAQQMLEGKPSAAQFSPSDEPRAVRRAAYRVEETGRIFTGTYHQQALDAAKRAGVNLWEGGRVTDGWVTNEGEFLDRRQAARRAEEMGQVTPGRVYPSEGLHSGDMDLAQFQPGKNVRPLDELPDTKEKLFPGIQFQPSNDPRAIRTAAVRDPETGKTFEGAMHFYAMTAAMDAGIPGTKLVDLDQGFLTNSGEWLGRTEAFQRAQELGQLTEKVKAQPVAEGFTRGLMSEDLGAKPVPAADMQRALDKVAKPAFTPEIKAFTDHLTETSLEEWSDWAHTVPGGLTGVAHQMGLKAKTPADLALFRSVAEQYESLTKAALANDNVEQAIILSSKSQAARESYESATGKTLSGEKDILTTLKRLHGPGYEPPMAEAQFLPGHRTLGRTEDDLSVRGVDLAKEDRQTHFGLGMGESDIEGTNWRYDHDTKHLFWWGEKGELDPAIQEETIAWLQKKGLSVTRQRYLSGYSDPEGTAYDAAHAQFAPVAGEAEAMEQKRRLEGAAAAGDLQQEAQFAPSTDPRAVKTSIIFDPESDKYFRGANHGLAWEAARDAGIPERVLSKWRDGFITNSGERLTRTEAYARAVELGQVKAPKVVREMAPEDRAEFLQRHSLGRPLISGDYRQTTAQFAADKKQSPQEKANDRAYQRDSVGTHGWWLNPAGDLLRLSTGEHATDALKILNVPVSKKDRYDAYSAAAIDAYNTLVNKGWRAILPQTYYRGGEPVSTLLFRGSGEGEVKINKAQRNALEILAIKHDLAILNNLGDAIYKPPTMPKAPEEPAMLGSVQFSPFQSKTFDKELEKIRKGIIGGQTFTPAGEIWESPKTPSDLVSLASVNVPLGKLTREAVETALAPYADLLDEPQVTAGMFAFSKDGVPIVSIDVNAVVDQAHRVNTLDFAKQNDQVAIWDAKQNEEVKAGGSGDTKLKTLGEIYDALRPLLEGEPVDVAAIKREHTLTPEIEPELGMDLPKSTRPLSTGELGRMTKADIAAHYPEAVIPRSRDEAIPSDILNSPLAKSAGSREAAVQAFARKLVEFAKEHEDHPAFQSGLRWYSEFVPKLKKVFGKDAPIFAELLAGTSPNTSPKDNYAMAEDALARFKAGKFDAQIKKFEDGLDMIKKGSWREWIATEIAAGKVKNAPETPSAETFLNHWVDVYSLKPRKANGKLYGISSGAVLRILARRWLANTPGLKTQNFVKNLLGTGFDATIDLWADRTMRRVGYSGTKERWRILPKNSTGVTDADFLFAQDAFRTAAKEMGIRASSLQGGLWFAEKQLWGDKGWSRLDLGDFRQEIKGTEKRKASKEKPMEQPEFGIVEPR